MHVRGRSDGAGRHTSARSRPLPGAARRGKRRGTMRAGRRRDDARDRADALDGGRLHLEPARRAARGLRARERGGGRPARHGGLLRADRLLPRVPRRSELRRAERRALRVDRSPAPLRRAVRAPLRRRRADRRGGPLRRLRAVRRRRGRGGLPGDRVPRRNAGDGTAVRRLLELLGRHRRGRVPDLRGRLGRHDDDLSAVDLRRLRAVRGRGRRARLPRAPLRRRHHDHVRRGDLAALRRSPLVRGRLRRARLRGAHRVVRASSLTRAARSGSSGGARGRRRPRA